VIQRQPVPEHCPAKVSTLLQLWMKRVVGSSVAVAVGAVGVRTPPNIQVKVSDSPKILVYIVTCNWSSSTVNLFNPAVTTHHRPLFASECTETVWRPGSAQTPWGAHTAASDLLTAFKGWNLAHWNWLNIIPGVDMPNETMTDFENVDRLHNIRLAHISLFTVS